MTEFIINSDQLERIIEAVEHDTGREVNRVIIDGERMPEVVRCRDCKHYHAEINGCDEFGDIWHDEYANVEPYGYCAWGERNPE